MIKIIQHTDPKHSWFGVKRSLLRKLGILKKISKYSYQQGGTVYLEEDMDMQTFVTALGGIEKFKAGFEVRESFQEYSPIRCYDHFKLSQWEIKENV